MGREIKRVALDFDWPLDVSWKGYHNPYCSIACKLCEQSGLNPATKRLSDDWYTHSRKDGGEGWVHHLEQSEVDALIEAGRLHDFTHTWSRESGWRVRADGFRPTAEQVNQWSRKGMGHDAINQWICVETRATRLGFYGHCSLCRGKGYYWCEDKYEQLHEDWTAIEPPEGDGWQLWETVSEGSPITPVFATAEEFVTYLGEKGDAWDQKRGEGGWGIENARKFLECGGWAPTLIGKARGLFEPRDMAAL